jgi:hypothetical protein
MDVYPFSSTLLIMLDVWDMLALSHTCTDMQSFIRCHSSAFTHLDLRHPTLVAAIGRLLERESHTPPSGVVSMWHWLGEAYDSMRWLPSTLPLGLKQLLPLLPPHRWARVKILRLDGLHIDRNFLADVFPRVAPTLEFLGLSYAFGCSSTELVDEFLLHKWPQLKICKIQNWLNPEFKAALSRLVDGVEGTVLRLEFTKCPENHLALQAWPKCELCGVDGNQCRALDCDFTTKPGSKCNLCRRYAFRFTSCSCLPSILTQYSL